MLKMPEEFVGRSWQNILTGVVLDQFALDSVFADLPVAVLEQQR